MLDLSTLYEEEVPATTFTKEEAKPKYDETVHEKPTYDYKFDMEDYKKQSAPLIEYLSQGYKKPEPEITPEQAKRAKFASSITDSLSLLAQMYTAGRGAYTRPDTSPGSTNVTQQRLDKLRDDYMKRQMVYEGQMANVNQTALNMYNKDQQARYDRNYQAELADYNRKIANQDYNNKMIDKELQEKNIIDHRYKAMQAYEDSRLEGRKELERLKAGLKPIKSAGGRVSAGATANGYTIVRDGQAYNIPKSQWEIFTNTIFGKLNSGGYNIGDNAYLQNTAQIKQYVESQLENIPIEVWDSAIQLVGVSPIQGQTNQKTTKPIQKNNASTSGGKSRASKASSSGGTSRAR